jgi:hypothetical protein
MNTTKIIIIIKLIQHETQNMYDKIKSASFVVFLNKQKKKLTGRLDLNRLWGSITHKDVLVSGGVSPRILSLGSRWSDFSAPSPIRFTSWKRVPSTSQMGRSFGLPRACVDEMLHLLKCWICWNVGSAEMLDLLKCCICRGSNPVA